jgi:hypothetical protein
LILSSKFRFVFIKGKRVGGTSAEMALSTICGLGDIVTPMAPIDELARMRLGGRAQNYASDRTRENAYIELIQRTPTRDLPGISVPKERYYNHMPLREIIDEYGPEISKFNVICVERSPFSKILSWANWLASSDEYLAGGRLQRDFSALRRAIDRIFESGEFIGVRNIDLYRGHDGRIAVRAMRYENLEADLREFFRSLGVAEPPILPHAKEGLLSDRLDPREFFSGEQRRMINDAFGEEFDVFGYPRVT